MIDPSAFLARGVIVLGRVSIGTDSSIWYQTVIRGDTEQIRIGASTNIQDLCMVHADPATGRSRLEHMGALQLVPALLEH